MTAVLVAVAGLAVGYAASWVIRGAIQLAADVIADLF